MLSIIIITKVATIQKINSKWIEEKRMSTKREDGKKGGKKEKERRKEGRNESRVSCYLQWGREVRFGDIGVGERFVAATHCFKNIYFRCLCVCVCVCVWVYMRVEETGRKEKKQEEREEIKAGKK